MALQKFWQSSCWGTLHCKSSGRAFTAEFSTSESFGRTFAAHDGTAKVLAELMLGNFALQEFWQSFYSRTQRFGAFWQNVCSPLWPCKSSGRAISARFSALKSFVKTFAAHNGTARILAELMRGKFALKSSGRTFARNFWHCKSSGRAFAAGFSASESFGRTFAAHYGLAKVLT